MSGRANCLYCDGEPAVGDVCAACIQDEMDRFDEEDIDPEGPEFECAGFNDGSGFYCPLWGSEECDWECPRGGMG